MRFDLRVSIVPTVNGEKIVLRFLSSYIGAFGFSELGLSEKAREIVVAASKKPFGLILSTGPTIVLGNKKAVRFPY